ncbi:MAG TPA: hypothetical protein VF535_14005, partial [Allosphingosinicella sp.]
MKTRPTPLARAAALLLAAAALPLVPAIGQETSPPAESPATETPPPDATTSIPPPEATTPAPETPAAETPAPAPAARTTTRRTETRTIRRVPATVPGPAVPVAVVPVPTPVDTLPPVATAPLPPPVAQTPPLEVLPETPPAPVATTVETRDSRDSLLPWLLGGLLLLGALAFFALRGRRGAAVHDRVYERPPVATVPGEAVPLAAAAPVVTPVEPVAPVVPAGRPELNLTMRPVRAGVIGDDARVEFQLTVGNSGPVAAENVR